MTPTTPSGLLSYILNVRSLSIDLEDPDVLKDFSSIFIKAMTKHYARDRDIKS